MHARRADTITTLVSRLTNVGPAERTEFPIRLRRRKRLRSVRTARATERCRATVGKNGKQKYNCPAAAAAFAAKEMGVTASLSVTGEKLPNTASQNQ